MNSLFKKAKNAAYENIERKDYTNSAIGVVIARIIEAVIKDEKSVIPVSVYIDGEYDINDICMSLPSVVGIEGVKNCITPELTSEEIAGLRDSANTLSENLSNIEVDKL